MNDRAIAAEFTGTALLVFFGVGAAAVAGPLIGPIGIALVFGLVLLALAYALGPVCGAHLNPAVTFGLLLAGRIGPRTAVRYAVAQCAGGVVGAGVLYVLVSAIPGFNVHGAFGTNGWGSRSAVGINGAGAFLAEAVLTMLLVLVVLGVTRRGAAPGAGGAAIGLTLSALVLVGLPLTGCGVNPARSLGPAVFAGGPALSQLWLFLVAPLVGGALAAGVDRLIHPVPRVTTVVAGRDAVAAGAV
ncbi:aquaporin [Streptomyces erythrochromogenes]|uniref:aquaporin n=1 Tax=Streptomyces erythrochromogenes TaxID=285574 RepID=UPI0037CFB532